MAPPTNFQLIQNKVWSYLCWFHTFVGFRLKKMRYCHIWAIISRISMKSTSQVSKYEKKLCFIRLCVLLVWFFGYKWGSALIQDWFSTNTCELGQFEFQSSHFYNFLCEKTCQVKKLIAAFIGRTLNRGEWNYISNLSSFPTRSGSNMIISNRCR